MKLANKLGVSLIVVLVALSSLPARSVPDGAPQQQLGLANTVVLVIRHAEKPDSGNGLTLQGQQHAREYVTYFQNYKIDGHLVHLDYLFAAADTSRSSRPRLTIEPLSKALGLPIDSRFTEDQTDDIANALRAKSYGKHILICWHHGEIPDLLTALGADPNTLVPGGEWPSGEYNWVIQISYDKTGHIIPSETCRVDEHLP